MKKLYKKLGKVHPSPPPIADHLSLLPVAVLTLTATLSPEDKQVLAYLISCCGSSSGYFSDRRKITQMSGGFGGGGDHVPIFECCCFSCYTSFWARWDASPNRQLIHEIIEAYEEGLFQEKRNLKKKKKKKKERGNRISDELKDGTEMSFGEGILIRDELGELESVEVTSCGGGGGGEYGVEVDGEVGLEKGPVRKIVSFIGERIWGVWNRN